MRGGVGSLYEYSWCAMWAWGISDMAMSPVEAMRGGGRRVPVDMRRCLPRREVISSFQMSRLLVVGRMGVYVGLREGDLEIASRTRWRGGPSDGGRVGTLTTPADRRETAMTR